MEKEALISIIVDGRLLGNEVSNLTQERMQWRDGTEVATLEFTYAHEFPAMPSMTRPTMPEWMVKANRFIVLVDGQMLRGFASHGEIIEESTQWLAKARVLEWTVKLMVTLENVTGDVL